MSIKVNTNFDAGNINCEAINDPTNLRFTIPNDTNSEFAQWFYFQLTGIQGQELTLHLEQLDKTAYPQGWLDYNVCASYDNETWFRIPCHYDQHNHILSWSLTATSNAIFFAYFEPYSYQRHLNFIAKLNSSPLAIVEHIELTACNNPVDLIRIGNHNAQQKIWIIARQHPGETMAEWFMEGLISRLVDQFDAISKVLREQFEFYLVPNMNPDGSIMGNLRTNSTGTNLNREWLNPSEELSPEVLAVRKLMLTTGVEMFFDIHGDESLPYIFTSGCADNKSFSAKQQRYEEKFETIFQQINPDYQTTVGYPKNHFSLESPTIATKWVGNQFDCLAYTLEMPFKDNANLPNQTTGWNGYRSKLLGASLLTAIHQFKYHI